MRDRARVIPMAVAGEQVARCAARRPADAPDGPFLLCIGNDFRHKNRLFAIKLLAELRARGWDGSPRAGRRARRARLVARRRGGIPRSRARAGEQSCTTCRPSDEAEKAWLYAQRRRDRLSDRLRGLRPDPVRGGASAGRRACSRRRRRWQRCCRAEAAVLVPWDAAASADRALPLLARRRTSGAATSSCSRRAR